MRRSLLWLLAVGWLWLPLALADQTTDAKQITTDEEKLKAAHLKTDGPDLLDFLKSRTLTDEDRERVDVLIAQLGASSYKVRKQASNDLIAKGPSVLEPLRQGLKFPDLEVRQRCEVCIQQIKELDPGVSGAVVRLVGVRKPPGAAEVLLAHLPYAESQGVADDIRETLAKVAVHEGKPDKALVSALTDKLAVRRAAAGEALVLAGSWANHKAEIRGLLSDANITVRWRVATALVMSKDKEAVPALIDLLPQALQNQAWQIEDILYRLAEGKSPPTVSLGIDEAGRRKCRDAWQAWWKTNAANVDLAVLQSSPLLLGRTTMILLDSNQIVEVEGDAVRWKIDRLDFPLDLQVLDNDRILIAEYYGQRVTERNLKGDVLWKYDFAEPQMAQRLPNGNTFMASRNELREVNPDGRQVFSKSIPLGGDGIMKCVKVPSTNEITCILESGRVVRINATGVEINSFRVDIGKPLFGGRLQVLHSGRVLIPQHLENKVAEYDNTGALVWQVHVDQPIAATRLPNGNTLVTSMSQRRAVEFDRNGKEVWQFQSPDSKVTRAIRR